MSCGQKAFAYDNDTDLREEFGRRPAEPNQHEQIPISSKPAPTPLQENTLHSAPSITVTQPEEKAQATGYVGSSVCHKTTCKRLIVGLWVAVVVVVIILTATFLSLNRNDGKQSVFVPDVDECGSNPCRNGGTCTGADLRYQCNCKPGYTGDNCHLDIDECRSNPCSNGGNCTDDVDRYQCNCLRGFTGRNCHIDVNECGSSPCRHGGNCTDYVGRYHCNCPPGFTGDNCDINIDECWSNPCYNGGNCHSDGYHCGCPTGYTGDNCNITVPLFGDCGDILESNPTATSGVYHITFDWRTTVDAFCDMDTDGGGWLVFQKRFNGKQEFFLDWEDYANGFGSLDGEFWWENWFEYSVGNPFSTRDRDNDDNSILNLASYAHGAWWYPEWTMSNLNGRYCQMGSEQHVVVWCWTNLRVVGVQ